MAFNLKNDINHNIENVILSATTKTNDKTSKIITIYIFFPGYFIFDYIAGDELIILENVSQLPYVLQIINIGNNYNTPQTFYLDTTYYYLF